MSISMIIATAATLHALAQQLADVTGAEGFSERTGLQVTCRTDESSDNLRIDLRQRLLRLDLGFNLR
mgnify:CR=1 FL=1